MTVFSNFNLLLLHGFLTTAIFIDIREFRVPNWLNGSVAVMGLSWQFGRGCDAVFSVLSGSAAIVLILVVLRRAHYLRAGNVGLGLGDIKLFGALSIWLHPVSLPLFIFVASCLGLLFVVFIHAISGWDPRRRLAFAPFIVASFLWSFWRSSTYV